MFLIRTIICFEESVANNDGRKHGHYIIVVVRVCYHSLVLICGEGIFWTERLTSEFLHQSFVCVGMFTLWSWEVCGRAVFH